MVWLIVYIISFYSRSVKVNQLYLSKKTKKNKKPQVKVVIISLQSCEFQRSVYLDLCKSWTTYDYIFHYSDSDFGPT